MKSIRSIYILLFANLQRMSKEGTSSLISYNSPSLIAKMRDRSPSSSSQPIFILCDNCYWCATYMDKTRIPWEDRCPQCNANNNELTSFPIASNESFTFDHNDKCRVELEFMPIQHNRKCDLL
jgi:hypothetical protein